MNKNQKERRANKTMYDTLSRMCQAGLIVPRTEKNRYLSLSYLGANGLISNKWNIKIYKSGKFVCNDLFVIRQFYHDRLKPPDKNLKLIEIDDAGIGFPLGGCMVGACCDGRIVTDVVDVSFFRTGPFELQEYVEEYTKRGLSLIVKEFNASPETHRIEICSGHINRRLRECLRSKGYDARLADIKGLLQDKLEGLFKKHIKELVGKDLAYDPKELNAYQIGKSYNKAIKWGERYVPHLLKTGWEAIKSRYRTA